MQGKDQLEDSQNQLILFVRIHLTLFPEIQIYLSLERASWLHGKFIQIRIYRYHIFTHKDIITFCMFAKKKKSNISWRSLIHRKDQVWQIWPLADFFHLEEKPVQPKLNRHIEESFLKFRLMFNAIFFFGQILCLSLEQGTFLNPMGVMFYFVLFRGNAQRY